jgi:hypothetical protein
MHRVIRNFLFFLFAASFCAGSATGQQASASPSAAKSEPTPIPVAKVPLEAESTLTALQEINASESRNQATADLIAGNLATLKAEIDARMVDDTRLLASSQSLDTLHRQLVTWQNFSDNLSASARELARCATDLDEEIARLDQLEKIWQLTLVSAKQPETPLEVSKRVQSTLDSVELTRKMTESGRSKVLTVQTHLSEEEARVRDAITAVEQLQSNALKSLAVRDSPPIWNLGTDFGKEWKNQLGRTSSSQLTASTAFTERLPLTFMIHGLVVLLIAGAIQWMRRKIRKSPEKIQDLDRAMPIFDLPLSAAFALSILVVPSIYPEAPRLVQAVMGAIALLPTILILRRLLPRNFYPILNALVVMYFVGQLRVLCLQPLSPSLRDSSFSGKCWARLSFSSGLFEARI